MAIKGFGDINFQPSPRGYLKTAEDNEAIAADIVMLLKTNRGERVNLPDYGSNIERFLFEPITDILLDNVRSDIIETINRWENRIVVNDLEVTADEENHIVDIRIGWSPKNDLSQQEQLEILFRGS